MYLLKIIIFECFIGKISLVTDGWTDIQSDIYRWKPNQKSRLDKLHNKKVIPTTDSFSGVKSSVFLEQQSFWLSSKSYIYW